MSAEPMSNESTYLKLLNEHLKRPALKVDLPVAVDLFAGCGGLALGMESAGFHTIGYELDSVACDTYTKNLAGTCIKAELAYNFDFNLHDKIDALVGGPPCQPFSVGGNQAGPRDSRDGFPAFLSAVEQLQPKVAVFENVRGMLYKNKDYLNQIIEELIDLNYIVEDPKILKAVDFGVPQKRERLFVVAHRTKWDWPKQTHSYPISAGEALGELAQQYDSSSKFLTQSMDEYVAKYEKKSSCVRPRDLHLDLPSRTVTCRNLNGATGDMMRVKLESGKRRRLTVREGARLQSFPDWFMFEGNEGAQFNQIGNAVPPLLALAVGKATRSAIEQPTRSKRYIRSHQPTRSDNLFLSSAGV
jgi:DNA (cytosine-5)-methyltransferase 1